MYEEVDACVQYAEMRANLAQRYNEAARESLEKDSKLMDQIETLKGK